MLPAAPPESVDAVILCGGMGRRMGGQDKGLIELAGKPLYQHVLAQLPRAQLGQVYLSANRNQAEYARSGFPVLADVRPDYPGPLAGIEAAMLASSADWLLVLPCDMPRLPTDLLARLWVARDKAPVIRCHDEERPQPLLCLLQRRLLTHLQGALDDGHHAVMRWQDAAGARDIALPGRLQHCNAPGALRDGAGGAA
ncbi:glycosyltransferase family protein [Chitinimonas naiadis]